MAYRFRKHLSVADLLATIAGRSGRSGGVAHHVRMRDGRPRCRLKVKHWLERSCSSPMLLMTMLLVGIGCSRQDTIATPGAFEAKARWAVDAFDAPVMTQAQLQKLLKAARASDVLLVDTRSAQEYLVSRLPGAMLWDEFEDGPAPDRILQHAQAGRPVVFYCSIGYRSGMAAERITRQLGTDEGLANLKGGIFQWANEGRPLEGGSLVHGYDDEWSRFLRPELLAPLE